MMNGKLSSKIKESFCTKFKNVAESKFVRSKTGNRSYPQFLPKQSYLILLGKRNCVGKTHCLHKIGKSSCV